MLLFGLVQVYNVDKCLMQVVETDNLETLLFVSSQFRCFLVGAALWWEGVCVCVCILTAAEF